MKKMLEINKKSNRDFVKNIYACITGGVAGLINGLFGGGGGMLVVPVLIYLLNVQVKNAHATAILIILPLSITSGLFYAAQGSIDINVAIPVGIGVVIGGVVGAVLLSKISSKIVAIIFSLVMAIAGIRLLAF